MILLPNLIGLSRSCWLEESPGDGDAQPHNRPHSDNDPPPKKDPKILWAVKLDDDRKVAIVAGAQLYIVQSAMNIKIFNGLSEIARVLLDLGINTYAEARAVLPVTVLDAIADIDEERSRNPPQQIPLPGSINSNQQLPLFADLKLMRAA